eukprot:GHVU01186717.1.p1 GENE.GHVU01186717.1~~GHVU01186717.1.p1  ORF type:complete len:225 (+),score=8.63 GHVU01186717.1:51-677(+)
MAESTAAERGKKKRKREAEPQGPRKSGLTLDTVLEQSLDNLPAFLDVNDNQLCLAALGGLERNVLTDMADYFIQSNGIEANESSGFAKPKFVYTRSDELDNFTYYSGQGCKREVMRMIMCSLVSFAVVVALLRSKLRRQLRARQGISVPAVPAGTRMLKMWPPRGSVALLRGKRLIGGPVEGRTFATRRTKLRVPAWYASIPSICVHR